MEVDDTEEIRVTVVGQPSVGKSSIFNRIIGQKVTKTKGTPGTTKHLQTYYLKKEEGSRNILLIDSPGIVFPVRTTYRALQIISGVIPLARTREFYTSLRFLWEHCKGFKEQLGLDLEQEHCPFSVLQDLAVRKGYISKGGRPNVHRAGQELLKDVIGGRISYMIDPPIQNHNSSECEQCNLHSSGFCFSILPHSPLSVQYKEAVSSKVLVFKDVTHLHLFLVAGYTGFSRLKSLLLTPSESATCQVSSKCNGFFEHGHQKVDVLKPTKLLNTASVEVSQPSFEQAFQLVASAYTSSSYGHVITARGDQGRPGVGGNNGGNGKGLKLRIECTGNNTLKLTEAIDTVIQLKPNEVILVNCEGGDGGKGGKGGNGGVIILKTDCLENFVHVVPNVLPGDQWDQDGLPPEVSEPGNVGSLAFVLDEGAVFYDKFCMVIESFEILSESNDCCPDDVLTLSNFKISNISKDMLLPKGAVLSVCQSESTHFSINSDSDSIYLPEIPALETITLNETIQVSFNHSKDFTPLELFIPETLYCQLDISLKNTCVLSHRHLAPGSESYQRCNRYKPSKPLDGHFKSINLIPSLKVIDFLNTSTVSPGETIMISFKVLNDIDRESRQLQFSLSENSSITVSSIAADDVVLHLTQDQNGFYLVDPIPSKKAVSFNVNLLISTSTSLHSTFSPLFTVLFQNIPLFKKELNIFVEGVDSDVLPQVLLVMTKETPRNEMAIWTGLLNILGISYMIWDCEVDGLLSTTTNSSGRNWKNLVDESGKSTFKVVMVLYCSYQFIKDINVRDILWLYESNCGFVFLRGNHTGQLLLQKLLSDWKFKACFPEEFDHRNAAKLRNALQSNDDVSHRYFLSIVNSTEPILNDLELVTTPKVINFPFSSTVECSDRYLVAKQCLLPSTCRFFTVAQVNQLGLIPQNRQVENLDDVIPPLRSRPGELLFFDSNNRHPVLPQFDSNKFRVETMDCPKLREDSDFLLQTSSNLNYDSFVTFIVNQSDPISDTKGLINLGHPCKSRRLAIASLFGIGLYSLILALPMESKLKFLNDFNTFEPLDFVLPGGRNLSIVDFCILSIVFELENEALLVRSESLLDSFKVFSGVCQSVDDSPQVNNPKMTTYLYVVLIKMKSVFSIGKNISKSKGSFKNFKHIFNARQRFQSLLSLLSSNLSSISEEETSLLFRLEKLTIQSIVGLDKLSKMPLFARDRNVTLSSSSQVVMFYNDLRFTETYISMKNFCSVFTVYHSSNNLITVLYFLVVGKVLITLIMVISLTQTNSYVNVQRLHMVISLTQTI
ncbi:hypothetical protein GEMRC1_010430 [Eukaryota sp. GEM-RC1]